MDQNLPGQDSVKSLMNPRVISVLPDTPIVTAIDILLSNNYSGIPVTDKQGVLVGILTKYDIIVKRASVVDDTKVRDLMNNDPLVLSEDMSVEDAVKAFSEHHKVDPIPVVNGERKVIGIISRFDMVRMFREYGSAFDGKSNKSMTPEGGINSVMWIVVCILIAIGIVIALNYFGFLGNLF